MKLKEMIERVQQHHPDMGEVEIVRSLNDAMNDYKQEMYLDFWNNFLTVERFSEFLICIILFIMLASDKFKQNI